VRESIPRVQDAITDSYCQTVRAFGPLFESVYSCCVRVLGSVSAPEGPAFHLKILDPHVTPHIFNNFSFFTLFSLMRLVA
jgi:hypothetical protein